ncbi:M3 family metallopeptidase [Paraferrimonas sp. SM1919]|uniref:M3 family metallopeptidase n=1 Tax=Paraferrimonas sp. SM1919 TaxID=2662263 RepID=UPI0013D28945|nr:M3 family metallopeptidase [Paraferrimonas sp. SM1919]
MLKNSLALAVVIALSGCQPVTEAVTPNLKEQAQVQNPLFSASTLQYQAPRFDIIKESHFKPAILAGIKSQLAEIEKIADNPDVPTFDNTIVAMELSGELLSRATSVFYNLTGTMSNENIRALQAEFAPLLSKHSDDIYLNKALFNRVQTLYNNKQQLALDAESARLLQIKYDEFINAGAKLTDAAKDKVRKLNAELAGLQNKFGENQLGILSNEHVLVANVAELDGLTEGEIAAAAELAKASGKVGYALKLANTTRQPVLQKLNNRELRQRIWEASSNRATEGQYATLEIVKQLAELRAQKAAVLGYKNWAEYRLNGTMAKTPQAVLDMFSAMVPKVVANAQQEQADIQAMINKTGGDFELQPWDWAYYAEKVRKEKFAIDQAQLMEYFEFNSVLNNGVFYTMEKLFGITFKERNDLPVYHEDVKTYEIFDADGTSIALFYTDYFARPGKRGGAWMSAFVSQTRLKEQKPVIVNVMNIPKAVIGQAQLVSFDNASTMFHELGHGLHGAFSDVNYPSLAGTNVSRDVVEFPSTFQEDWAIKPEVLANYAKHYKTGEAIPQELLDKALKAASFNQGFDTLEYMSAAMLDQEWHAIAAGSKIDDVEAFEQAALKKHGVDIAAIPPRYKSQYFSHTFTGGYSASYYAYMWSEIMAADAYKYVQQNGGLNREMGDKFRKHILSVGNAIDPMQTYINFRGKAPSTDALLERRGIN